ncbi:MAG: FtsW/RodA/SpoVE family cell cycle protein [Planctomycetes bacterium]|nr:FtsW/RodA/SpoVE family cell cycle protein [Planctomycetota bacterium]
MNKTHKNVFIAIASILSVISLFSIFSLSINGSLKYQDILSKQALFIVAGLSAAIILSKISYYKIVRVAPYIYIAVLLLLIYLLAFGVPIRGSKGWIKIGTFSLQPAEFVKVCLIPLFALNFKYPLKWTTRSIYYTCISIAPALLIALQPDLGMATLIIVFFISSLFTTVIKQLSQVTIIITAFIVLTLPLFGFVLKDYHKQRISGFFSNKQSTNFQQFNSVKLIGYGGFAGRGIGEVSIYSPLYVPDRHNDFLFSCIGEEFGFVGSVAIILMYFLLVYRLFDLADLTRDIVASKLLYFSGLYLMIQGFTNLAVNLGMLPVIGINMPFFGYGGSSTISCYLLLGIILSVLQKPVCSFRNQSG